MATSNDVICGVPVVLVVSALHPDFWTNRAASLSGQFEAIVLLAAALV